MFGVWILFISIEDAAFELSTEWFPNLIPQDGLISLVVGPYLFK